MARFRKRRPRKPKERARARWYASRGYPLVFIAEKLDVSRNTVAEWCSEYNDDRAFKHLVQRVRRLPAHQRFALIERVSSERRAA